MYLFQLFSYFRTSSNIFNNIFYACLSVQSWKTQIYRTKELRRGCFSILHKLPLSYSLCLSLSLFRCLFSAFYFLSFIDFSKINILSKFWSHNEQTEVKLFHWKCVRLWKLLYIMYSWFYVCSGSSLRLGCKMNRLRQVMRQVVVFLSTSSLGVVTFLLGFLARESVCLPFLF